MKTGSFVLALLVLLTAVSASAMQPIAHPAARAGMSLDGKWRVIVDPFEYGYYESRTGPKKNGFFMNQKPKDRSERIEYDFDTSDQLDVPGDWNSQREMLFLYEGTVWYKRSFDYAKKPDTRVFVHFGAVNYEALVWLNGTKVGEHVGGFTPFDVEVTDALRDRDNFLIVKVDNKRRADGIPTSNSDWWNYGGITRSVALLEVPSTFVADWFIQLDPKTPSRVAGWVRLDGAKKQQRVSIGIAEARVTTSVVTDENGFAKVALDAPKLARWSPEDPKLYDVTITAETDGVTDRIGFRTIETRGTEILLNGKPQFLRGVSIHEEAPFRAGRAHNAEDARTLLGWAKELGCNFVRLAHYPHNETMVREADRLGLMVWSEVPVYWTIDFENEATFANARNQLSESIARDHNRAAVILWSVANETSVSPARNSFLGRLVRTVRELDPTRLVTAAMLHKRNDTKEETTEFVIDDPLGADLDVLGCNEYIGWYDGLPDKLDRAVWKSPYDKPLVMSEFGGDALYGLRGDALTRWTEDYQESLYQHQVAMLDRIPFLRGTTPWILMDFRSPRRTLPNIQDFFNRKGLVAVTGEKKKAFYVMQQWYAKKRATK